MRILHVAPSIGFAHGGVSTSIRQWCRSLSKWTSLEIHLWSVQRAYDKTTDEPADQALRQAGVHLRYFPQHAWTWLANRYAYSPKLQEALLREVSEFDLIHVHGIWLYTTAAVRKAGVQHKVPYLISPCGALDPHRSSKRQFLKQCYAMLVEKQNLAQAARIHFTTQMEANIAQSFGVTTPPVILPRFLDPEDIPSVAPGTFRATYPELHQKKMLLFLGRLTAKKRLDLLVEIFDKLHHKDPQTHLVIAGPDENQKAKIQAWLAQHKLSDAVTWAGSLSGKQKWAALQDADYFLLPSDDENFGVSVLEAMYMKTPVLISPHVALAEWIEPAKAGLVLKQDAELWANSLAKLIQTPEEGRQLSEAGFGLVQTSFLANQVAQTIETEYQHIVENR